MAAPAEIIITTQETDIMGLCKNCKYWRNGDGLFTPKDRGVCMKFMEKEIPEDGVQQPPDKDQYEDYVEMRGWVKTGPLFGCIHFNAMQTKNIAP